MEVQSLPVIYALSMVTVPCMFLLGACFSLCLPASFFFVLNVNNSCHYAV